MTMHSARIRIALVALFSLFATQARAQTPAASQPAEPLVFGTGATYEVLFDDDPLAAIPNGTIIPIIKVIGLPPHAPLMRPRTQFVVEMLKSTETL